MEAIRIFETLVLYHACTRRYNQQDIELNLQRCTNPKSLSEILLLKADGNSRHVAVVVRFCYFLKYIPC